MMPRDARLGRRPALFSIALALVVGVLVWLGWRETSFLTDDSYIQFRYVSNAMAGRGLVWNPAPFHPVEGYTSFAWVMLLWAVWALAGVEPPDAANFLGLLFGYGTLAIGWRILQRMALPDAVDRHRRWLAAIVLLSVATNRVFLTWLNSGLGTAMFVFSVTWWVGVAVAPRDGRALRHTTLLSLAAALTAWTRPDGLLFVAATVLLVTVEAGLRRRAAGSRLGGLLGLWPLLAVAGHLLWHRWYYGECLPNTYYAKNVNLWPEAGWRYVASYVVENGVWAWFLLAGACAIAAARRGAAMNWPTIARKLGGLTAVGVMLAHTAYYSIVIGGDFFEYRVLAHLPLLLMLGAVWMAAWAFRRPAVVLTLLTLTGLAPLPLAWLEWRHHRPLAPHVPTLVRPAVRAFDAWQAWLQKHFVCVRQRTLAAHLDSFFAQYGSRAEGERIPWDDRPVVVGAAIGALGWILPNVAVIDSLGLTDWVVARNPVQPKPGIGPALLAMFDRLDTDTDGTLTVAEQYAAASGPLAVPGVSPDTIVESLRSTFSVAGDEGISRRTLAWMTIGLDFRQMAHERTPPPGYLEGFRPNVRCVDQRFVVEPRSVPLTDADIIAHETAYQARFR